jgi:hypothetical protein
MSSTKIPEAGCALHSVHNPSVAEVTWLDVAGVQVAVCPTGARNYEVALRYMLGEGDTPAVKIGRSTWDLAQRQVDHLTRRASA